MHYYLLRFLHFWEKIALHNRVFVNLARHVKLQLELVTDSQQFILLSFEYMLDDVEERFLSKVDEAVEDLLRVLVRYHVGEQTEKGIANQSFKNYIA